MGSFLDLFKAAAWVLLALDIFVPLLMLAELLLLWHVFVGHLVVIHGQDLFRLPFRVMLLRGRLLFFVEVV